MQNSFPIRFREIHIVNESYLFDMTFALVKPFLSEKIRTRIRCHGSDLASLHRAISPLVRPNWEGNGFVNLSCCVIRCCLPSMEGSRRGSPTVSCGPPWRSWSSTSACWPDAVTGTTSCQGRSVVSPTYPFLFPCSWQVYQRESLPFPGFCLSGQLPE